MVFVMIIDHYRYLIELLICLGLLIDLVRVMDRDMSRVMCMGVGIYFCFFENEVGVVVGIKNLEVSNPLSLPVIYITSLVSCFELPIRLQHHQSLRKGFFYLVLIF